MIHFLINSCCIDWPEIVQVNVPTADYPTNYDKKAAEVKKMIEDVSFSFGKFNFSGWCSQIANSSKFCSFPISTYTHQKSD